MMVKHVTCPWKTGEITVMSNVTSIQVVGNKITKIGAIQGQETDSPASIYIDLDVMYKQPMPSILASTEELGLILNVKDALELGLLLVAMGMETNKSADVSVTLERLSKLITELK